VVAHPSDHVDVAALAQELGGVLGLHAPQRPQDRGGLLFSGLTAAPTHVADGGELGLGNGAVAAVDLFEPDIAGEMRIALDDQYMGHGMTPHEHDRPGSTSDP